MTEFVDTLTTMEVLGIKLWVLCAAFGAVFLGFVGKKLVGLILSRFIKAAQNTSFRFDDILFKALLRPAQWAAMFAGIFVALLIMPIPKEPLDLEQMLRAVINGVSVALVVWFAIRLIDGLADIWTEKAAKTESKLDDQLVPIIRRSCKVFLFIVGIVLVLQNMGYSVGSLLAGLGIGGVALAMASKDTVSNLFGSLVIFLDKPFHIGDWIEMSELEGTVEEVGLRTTRVRTFANSLMTVPNMKFTTQTINNWSQMKKRRIKMTVGVTYDASPGKVESLVERIRQIIKEDQNIRDDFFLVNFDNFGPSSLDIFIYCFTETTVWGEFLQAKQEFMLKIMQAVEELNLSFAFPTQSIHVESIKGEPEALTGQRPL